MISKSLSTSEKFASLTVAAGPLAEFCQLLYPLIVAHADDFGRLQGDTFTIKHMCFPSSPRSVDDFSTALAYLHASGMVIRYEIDGKRYIQINSFDQHQTGLYKRTASKFPEITGTSEKVTELPAQENLTELNLTEQNGTKESTAAAPRLVPVENPNDYVRVITRLAHEVAKADPKAGFADMKADLKAECARLKIPYDADVSGKALESALEQRRRSA
jgi:hypothetical protein